MAGTPLFVITDAGLAAASVATPTGPYIHITSFEVGSGYGYTPLPSDTGLNGSLEYSGTPTAYQSIGNNTLNIICEIPPDAGPFNFGEVALFLDGGVMFAKAVFDTPQTKFSALGSNVVSSYTFNCLLKLQQSTAVFQIDTENGPPAVYNVFQWSDVYPPGVSANPDIPLYLVKELDPAGDSTLLQNTSNTNWSVGTTYQSVFDSISVQNSSTTWVEFLASNFSSTVLASPNREWLLETPDGFFRSVSSVTTSGSNYRFNLNCSNDGTYNNTPLLNAPSIGSDCRLYAFDITGDKIYYSQIINPPPAATAGQGLYSPTAGTIAGQGLLHSPGSNTGRPLTSADNLNSTSLLSGMYATAIDVLGLPANMPVSSDGHIWIHNYGGGQNITQYYIPNGAGGGGAGTGQGGLPMYWRAYASGIWYPWYPISSPGKNPIGVSSSWTLVGNNTQGTFTETNTQGVKCLYSCSPGTSAGLGGVAGAYQISGYVNGVLLQVAQAQVASNGGIHSGVMTLAAAPGDVITFTSAPYQGPPGGGYMNVNRMTMS